MMKKAAYHFRRKVIRYGRLTAGCSNFGPAVGGCGYNAMAVGGAVKEKYSHEDF